MIEHLNSNYKLLEPRKKPRKKRDPKTYKGGRKKIDTKIKKVRVDVFIEQARIDARGGINAMKKHLYNMA